MTVKANYDFADYLASVPSYNRKNSATLQDRATTAANLIFDPQRAEQRRAGAWNETQHINNMQKLKASTVGVEDALAYNNAQAKKAAAVRSAGSGAVGSSGLTDYLNNEADASTQAQRLNIAATLAANNTAEVQDYSTLDRQSQEKLGDIETLRGQTSSSLYDTYEDAQDTAENNWNQNALSVALGIGSGEMQAADLNGRQLNEANRIAESRYEADLPYNAMTQYQQGQLDLDTTVAMGKTAGSKSSSSSKKSSSSSSNSNNSNQVYGLRGYAEQSGKTVGYDANTGNVTVGSKTFTPANLQSLGGYINNSGRWVLPKSALGTIMG